LKAIANFKKFLYAANKEEFWSIFCSKNNMSKSKYNDQERPFHSAITVSTKELPRINTSKSQKSDYSRANSRELNNFTRFIDFSTNNTKPPVITGKMTIIKSRLESNPTSRTTNVTPIKVKFNESKKKNSNLAIDNSKFVFEDRSLYKIYLQLCQKRDAITPVSPDRIEYLKKGNFSLYEK
jgi:hypothetical protein